MAHRKHAIPTIQVMQQSSWLHHAAARCTAAWAPRHAQEGAPQAAGTLWLSFVGGGVLGVAAWGEGRVPLLALALPLLVAGSASRAHALWLAAGYATGVLRHAVTFIAGWFDDRLTVGVAAVAVYALATGALWSCGWSGHRAVGRRIAAITAAWWLALAAGIVVPGHPLVAAGFAVPGTGWWGVLLAAAAPAAALALLDRFPARRQQRAGAALLLLPLAGAGALLPSPGIQAHGGALQAQSTAWGALRDPDEVLVRIARMGQVSAAAPAGSTLIWPEGILARYERALEPVLAIEVLQRARALRQTVVIGLDLPTPEGRLRNAAVAFFPDGRRAVASARQPAPLSLWQPWRATGTFVADWGARNVLALGTERAAVIFCYEEYMPVLYLLNEAWDAPTLYLALANTWAARHPEAAAIQTWHSLGMARLFGRPYLKAENRAAP